MNDLPKEIMEGVNELIQAFREIDFTDIKEGIHQFRGKWIEPDIRWESELRRCYDYEHIAVHYIMAAMKCLREKKIKRKLTYGTASDEAINGMLLQAYKDSKYADFSKRIFHNGFDHYAENVMSIFINNVILFQKKDYEAVNKISVGYMFFNYIVQRESKDDTIRKRNPYDDKAPLLKSIDLLSVGEILPEAISLEAKYQQQLTSRAREIQENRDLEKAKSECVLRKEIDSLILLVSKAWDNRRKLGESYELHRRWNLIVSMLNNMGSSMAVFLIYALALESEHLVQLYKEKYLVNCEEDEACLHLIRNGYVFTAIRIMKERPGMSLKEFLNILKNKEGDSDIDKTDDYDEIEILDPDDMRIMSDLFERYSSEFYAENGINLFIDCFMPKNNTDAVLFGKREMNNMVANILTLDKLIVEYEETHSKLLCELQRNLQYVL